MAAAERFRYWETKGGTRITRLLSGRSNVFLLTRGEKSVLIDTGIAHMWCRLRKRLHNLEIKNIDCLVLTHSHFDHAGSAWRIREEFGAEVIIHSAEADNLATGKTVIPIGSVPVLKGVTKLLTGILDKTLKCAPCSCDRMIGEIFDLDCFGFNAYILQTPGHTPGSVSIIADNEVAIVGDTMFGVFSGSIFPPFVNDIPMLIKSWSRLLETGCSLFIPAHGSERSREIVQKNYDRRKKVVTQNS